MAPVADGTVKSSNKNKKKSKVLENQSRSDESSTLEKGKLNEIKIPKKNKAKILENKSTSDESLTQPSTSVNGALKKEKLNKKRKISEMLDDKEISPEKSNNESDRKTEKSAPQLKDGVKKIKVSRWGPKKVKASRWSPVDEVKIKDEVMIKDGSSEQVNSNKRQRPFKGKRKEKVIDKDSDRTVFVGNLPLGITRKDIEKLFTPSGKVESVRLRSAIPTGEKITKKVAVITRQFWNNINGYVKFVDKDSVDKAVTLVNGLLFAGNHLQVDKVVGKHMYNQKKSIFVGNLPLDIKENELIEHFSDCGDVERVRIVRDKFTGIGKGFGFVVFKDETVVELALKLNDETFNGRQIRVKRVMKKFIRKNHSAWKKKSKRQPGDDNKKPKNKPRKKGKLITTIMT